MNWTVAAAGAAVVVVPLTVLGLLVQWRSYAAAAAKAIEEMRSALRAEGKASMAPTIDLLRSQRDDARRERDQALREAAKFEAWYEQLRRDRGKEID